LAVIHAKSGSSPHRRWNKPDAKSILAGLFPVTDLTKPNFLQTKLDWPFRRQEELAARLLALLLFGRPWRDAGLKRCSHCISRNSPTVPIDLDKIGRRRVGHFDFHARRNFAKSMKSTSEFSGDRPAGL